MRNKPTLTELVRDAALDDDFSIDEALVLIKRLNHVYGKDKATKKALTRLADILIGVQARARIIHQAAERDWLSRCAAERQDVARWRPRTRRRKRRWHNSGSERGAHQWQITPVPTLPPF